MENELKFKTIIDICNVFPNDKVCHQYLASQRWDSGEIVCPHKDCKHTIHYIFKDGIRYKCKKCKLLFTAKTGTFMDSSKLPTIKWLFAFYLVLHKKGISSVQLSKDIGVTQKTAWFMLQRIRLALGNEDNGEQLNGNIELDETFVGGKNKNRHADKKVKNSQGRSYKDKTPVMGMLQEQVYEIVERPHKVIPNKIVKEKIIVNQSIVKCNVVADTKKESIQPIIKDSVEFNSIIISDEWHGYTGLNKFYNHQIVDHGVKQYVNESGYTSNALEGFWSHAKRSIIGIYHKTTPKHLSKYFNEFSFRYNYRNLGTQEQIEVILANMVCRLKYKDLIA